MGAASVEDVTRTTRIVRRRDELRALGAQLSPDMVEGTMALMVPSLPTADPEDLMRTADRVYGSHERHCLDVYSSTALDAPRPVIVFVHGGGFVRGQKSAEGSPFYGNIGAWAVRQGFVAVAINYRLAPESPWPGGAEDIGAAIAWVWEHIGEYGGDAENIFLFGQSAGSMHVADYLAQPSTHAVPGGGLRGAALISCVYDLSIAEDKPFHRAYWGDDRETWPAKSSLDAIVNLELPLLLGVAELDEPQFLQQASLLTKAWYDCHGDFPPLHRLFGQNHLSTVYGMGGDGDVLGPLLEQFVRATVLGSSNA